MSFITIWRVQVLKGKLNLVSYFPGDFRKPQLQNMNLKKLDYNSKKFILKLPHFQFDFAEKSCEFCYIFSKLIFSLESSVFSWFFRFDNLPVYFEILFTLKIRFSLDIQLTFTWFNQRNYFDRIYVSPVGVYRISSWKIFTVHQILLRFKWEAKQFLLNK